MMIAARLAGGNLFFCLFWVEDFFGGGFLGALGALGAARSTRIFFEGIFGGGFWEHSEHSEQLGALGFFLRGFCWGGFFFFVGGWGVFWIVSVGKN